MYCLIYIKFFIFFHHLVVCVISYIFLDLQEIVSFFIYFIRLILFKRLIETFKLTTIHCFNKIIESSTQPNVVGTLHRRRLIKAVTISISMLHDTKRQEP